MKLKYNINQSNPFVKVEMEKGEIWMDNEGKIHQVPISGRSHEDGGELAMIENLYGLLAVNMVLTNSKRKNDLVSKFLMEGNKTYSDIFREESEVNAKKESKLVKHINLNKIRLYDLIAQNTVEQNLKSADEILSSQELFLKLFEKQESKKQDIPNKMLMQNGGKIKFKNGGLKLAILNETDKKDWLDVWSKYIGEDLTKLLFNKAEEKIKNEVLTNSKQYNGLYDYWNNKGIDYLKAINDHKFGLVHSSTLPLQEVTVRLTLQLGNILEFSIKKDNAEYKNNLKYFTDKNKIDLESLEVKDKTNFSLKDLQKYLLQNIKRILLTNRDLMPTKLAMLNALNRDLEYYNLTDVRYVNLKHQSADAVINQNTQDFNSLAHMFQQNLIGYSNISNIAAKKFNANNQSLFQEQQANNQIDNQQEQMNTQIYNNKALNDQQARGLFNESVQKSKAVQSDQLLRLNDSLSTMQKQSDIFNQNFELTQRMFPNYNYKGQFTGDAYLTILNLRQNFINQGYDLKEADNMAIVAYQEIEGKNGKQTKTTYKSALQQQAKDNKALTELNKGLFSK